MKKIKISEQQARDMLKESEKITIIYTMGTNINNEEVYNKMIDRLKKTEYIFKSAHEEAQEFIENKITKITVSKTALHPDYAINILIEARNKYEKVYKELTENK